MEEDEYNQQEENENEESYEEEEAIENYSGSSWISTIGSSVLTISIIAIILKSIFKWNWLPPRFISYIAALAGFLLLFFRLNLEWEESIILRLGKYHRTKKSGLYQKIPLFEQAVVRDMRIRTSTFTAEDTLTKDNVPVNIDAVVFWKVEDSKKSVIVVQDYYDSIKKASMTVLREIIGKKDLTELLSKREDIDKELKSIIDKKAERWGLDVESVELKEIRVPKSLQDAISRQAQAEREKQSRVILSQSEVDIAKKFQEASKVYEKNQSAMTLRGMNMLFEAVKEKGTFIIVPSEILSLFKGYKKGR